MKETPSEKLKRLQALPLPEKIQLSIELIIEWYEAWDGEVYVSFSGGKDSTVLLHLVRLVYPNLKAVFCNTGLEYPEIVGFVKERGNVIFKRPKKPFHQIINEYGYPLISKETSHKIYQVRSTNSDKLRKIRLYGQDNKYKSGKISEKWKFLINAPFKISHRCCDYLKKQPLKDYYNCYLGNMSQDSQLRKQMYIRNSGCGQLFSKNTPQSHPIFFWLEEDVWGYLKMFGVPYSKIYDMGYDRTGCMFCMFGVHLEDEPNRFQRMKETHPKHWKYCIEKLGLKTPLDYIGVPYE